MKLSTKRTRYARDVGRRLIVEIDRDIVEACRRLDEVGQDRGEAPGAKPGQPTTPRRGALRSFDLRHVW
jgi:hypothetical protein